MTKSITLTREEAQELLDLLEYFNQFSLPPHGIAIPAEIDDLMETLRARLSAPEPEPVADKYLMEIECTKCGAKQDGILTVNATQQRKGWQELSDYEVDSIVKASSGRESAVYLAEAKLREKNSA